MPVDRHVVDGDADVLGAEGRQDRAPVGAKPLGLEQHREDMPRVADIGSDGGQQEPRLTGQLRPVAVSQLGAPLQERLQPGELGEPECALQIRQPVVVPELHHGGVLVASLVALAGLRLEPVVPEPPQARVQLATRRGHQAALAGGDVLDGMEAEGRQVGERAHPPAPVLGAERMRRVLDEREPAVAREGAERVEVSRLAGVVDGHDGAGAPGEPGRDVGGVHVQRVAPHVGEDGDPALVQHGVGRRGEGKRGNDDLVPRPDAGRERCRVERGRARADRDRVGGAHRGGHGALELGDPGTGGEPAAAQHRQRRLHVVLVDRLPPVRQERGTRRTATVERERLTHRRAPSVGRARATHRWHRSSSGSPARAACRPPSPGSPTPGRRAR